MRLRFSGKSMWMPGTQSNFYAKLNLNVYLKPSRNTERGGGEVSGVKLFTVTNLSNINQKNADEVFRNGEKPIKRQYNLKSRKITFK